MTEKELEKVSFRCICHISLESEHMMSYVSEDGLIGFCDHMPYRNGQPHGRSYRHYKVCGKVYETKEKFLEALARL